MEARKVNGDSYPPSTVHQLLCALLRHMRSTNPGCPNFLNKQDSRFRPLQGTLDSFLHSLDSEGVGVQIKHAEIITRDDEAKLWSSDAMGLSSSRSLQNASFFVVGKFFALRGGVEHRKLKLSQLKRKTNPDQYIYYENVAKNRNGSFKQLHVKGKVVPLYSCPEAEERCPVNILDNYIQKRPQYAKENDIFYVRPLPTTLTNPTDPWYAKVPVGRDTLNKKFKIMCEQAAIKGKKTNHSLRATGVTQLYESGVPEKVIQERTGHRSLEALRVYERTNEFQHKAVSSILNKTHCEQSSRLSFNNLFGCTININAAPSTSSTTSVMDLQSVDESNELDFEKIVGILKATSYQLTQKKQL